MTFKTQHVPGPREVMRGRCRDYPWMIVDPEIGEIGRMMYRPDAIRAAKATELLNALGAVLALIKRHGLAWGDHDEAMETVDAVRLKKAHFVYEKTMMDLATRQGGEHEG